MTLPTFISYSIFSISFTSLLINESLILAESISLLANGINNGKSDAIETLFLPKVPLLSLVN